MANLINIYKYVAFESIQQQMLKISIGLLFLCFKFYVCSCGNHETIQTIPTFMLDDILVSYAVVEEAVRFFTYV